MHCITYDCRKVNFLKCIQIKEGKGDEPPLVRVWKAAHGDKNGVIDNENVQRILDKCVSKIFIFCIHVRFSW
jgi:hypothetical protein